MKTLVTTKINPDLDGIACALAYADFLNKTGQPAEAFLFGNLQPEIKFFKERLGIKIPQFNDSGNWENFVLVDASSMKGMPYAVQKEKVIEIIDHREGEPEKEFPKAKIQNELIGAAATLVTEKFMARGILPEADHAKLLFSAIFHNTLDFLSSNSSERDREAVKFLTEKFELKREIIDKMFEFSTKEISHNLKQAILDDAKEVVGRSKINALQLIVFGFDFLSLESELFKILTQIDLETGASWSFLNLVDLKLKQSFVYASNQTGVVALGSIYNQSFVGQKIILSNPVLRKQIIPLVFKA